MVDVHFYIEGKTRKIKADIIENNLNETSIAFWIKKHNRFSTKLAEEEIGRKAQTIKYPLKSSLWGNAEQKIIFLKITWDKLPLYPRPFLYFFWRYFILLGFLDGKQGFIYHFLQGLWYRLIVDIKIDELRRK